MDNASRQHADIGFRAGNDERVRLPVPQMRQQLRLDEAGIAGFIDDRRGSQIASDRNIVATCRASVPGVRAG
jgi:hypothetical protein